MIQKWDFLCVTGALYEPQKNIWLDSILHISLQVVVSFKECGSDERKTLTKATREVLHRQALIRQSGQPSFVQQPHVIFVAPENGTTGRTQSLLRPNNHFSNIKPIKTQDSIKKKNCLELQFFCFTKYQ